MKQFDIVALGELLVDFTPHGSSQAGMRLFEQNPGGAPANVLACAARLGLRTAFLGKVGADMHGDFLRETLAKQAINTSGLISDPDAFTTLAFVALSETGERSFSFARKPGADTLLCLHEVDVAAIRSSRMFHFGSLSLTDSPAREATLHALQTAKDAGVTICYDPNYRPPLWRDRETAIAQMRSVLPFVDAIKISDEETALLTGCDEPEQAAKELLRQGVSVVAVTLGAKGALVATADGMGTVPVFDTKRVDTTGAGDAFWGGFLYCLAQSGVQELCGLTLAQVLAFARFANAVASLCVEKRGAIPAMPTLGAVQALLQDNG